jgi:hypothetical protein
MDSNNLPDFKEYENVTLRTRLRELQLMMIYRDSSRKIQDTFHVAHALHLGLLIRLARIFLFVIADSIRHWHRFATGLFVSTPVRPALI